MRRFLSVKRSSTLPPTLSEKSPDQLDTSCEGLEGHSSHTQDASTTALVAPAAPLTPPTLKVKRVDYYWSRWAKAWKYKNMGEKVTPETVALGASSSNDPWQSFCFVVVRTFPRNRQGEEEKEPTFHIVVKSPYLLQACKDVIQTIPGLSWNDDPLEVTILHVL